MTNSNNFSDLGLGPSIIQSLDENKISEPTEIQQKVIPFILKKTQNLVGISQTGTGKTAAYGLPLLQLIDPSLHQIQLIIIVPTRELSQQIAKDLFVFSRYIIRIRTEAVFGGTKIEEQIKKLESPKHVLVATPGRLLDLLARKVVDFKYLKYLVLDEADQMLDMGFKSDIDKILLLCKPEVRKFLFTSTLPTSIQQIVSDYLGKDVHQVQVKPNEFVNSNIEHLFIPYQYGYKFQFMQQFLLTNIRERGIIFCRTQAAVKLLTQQLAGFDIEVGALYGDLSQYERNKVMTAFKTKRIQLLIATDIAARGLDVQDLAYVIHYHLPNNDAQYVNRSGRTARAGKTGKSICMLQEDEIYQVGQLETDLGIVFKPLLVDVVIDKSHSTEIALKINIGIRQDLNVAAVLKFLTTMSGVKEEFILDIELFRAHTTFIIDSRYYNQLINNINNTKHFHQKVLIEKV